MGPNILVIDQNLKLPSIAKNLRLIYLPATGVLASSSLQISTRLFLHNSAAINSFAMPTFSSPKGSSANSPSLGSTPIKAFRVSLEQSEGITTHTSVDRYVQAELDDNVAIDVEGLAEDHFLPGSGSERMKFDSMVTTVTSEIKEMQRDAKNGWMPPSTYSDSTFLPWVAEKAREICLIAIEYLEKDAKASRPSAKDAIESKMAELQFKDHSQIHSKWLRHLRTRHWAAKPGGLKGIAAKRRIDICLHVGAGGAKDADKVLIAGEHKSKRTELIQKEAIVQVGGYVGEILGAQPFRHHMPAFTLLQDHMRIWIFDRLGCYGSKEFRIAVNDSELFAFVEIMLALTTMSYAQLGYDKDVFADPQCSLMWTPLSSLPAGITGYVILGKERYSLREVIFIRPGLVCRGTICFTASLEGQEDVAFIFKTFWRSRTNSSEGELLGSVQKCPSVINLARMRSYDEPLTINRERWDSRSTGRVLTLNNRPEEEKLVFGSNRGPDVRVFSRLILEDRGHPLKEVETPLELFRSVLDAFRGHKTLYFNGGVLHRDISQSNILLRPRDDTSGYGFLIDLDYAVRIDNRTFEPTSSGANHRTGTLPFMAIGILRCEDMRHLYAHDVESFVYVLLWICLYDRNHRGYVPDDKEGLIEKLKLLKALKVKDDLTGTLKNPLRQWQHGSFRSIADSKEEWFVHQLQNFLRLLRPGFNGEAIVSFFHTCRELLFRIEPVPNYPHLEVGVSLSESAYMKKDFELLKKEEIALQVGVEKALISVVAELGG